MKGRGRWVQAWEVGGGEWRVGRFGGGGGVEEYVEVEKYWLFWGLEKYRLFWGLDECGGVWRVAECVEVWRVAKWRGVWRFLGEYS